MRSGPDVFADPLVRLERVRSPERPPGRSAPTARASGVRLQRRAGIKPPASSSGEELLLLLRDLAGLLRSLLHCALRLLSLLRFLSHVALLM